MDFDFSCSFGSIKIYAVKALFGQNTCWLISEV